MSWLSYLNKNWRLAMSNNLETARWEAPILEARGYKQEHPTLLARGTTRAKETITILPGEQVAFALFQFSEDEFSFKLSLKEKPTNEQNNWR